MHRKDLQFGRSRCQVVRADAFVAVQSLASLQLTFRVSGTAKASPTGRLYTRLKILRL